MPKNRNKDSNIPKWYLEAAIEIAAAQGTTWDDVLKDFIKKYVSDNMSILVGQAKRGRLQTPKEAPQKSAQQPASPPVLRTEISGTPAADTAHPAPSTAYKFGENSTS